jgi:hypothetical protein
MGSALKQFRAGFDGEALLPDAGGSDQARSVWNANIKPAMAHA